MIQSLIYLVIIGFILSIIFWLVDYFGLPQSTSYSCSRDNQDSSD